MLPLLLLLAGDVHPNSGPLCHLEAKQEVQVIILMQRKPPAVITSIQPALTTLSTQLISTHVPDGVCPEGDAASTALECQLAGEDFSWRSSLGEA